MLKTLKRIRTLYRFARGLGFAVWLVVSLTISTISLGLTTMKTTARLAVATAKVAQQATTIARQSKAIKSLRKTVAGSKKALKQQRDKARRKLRKQIVKAKAKGRLRRTVTAVPLLGVAAAVAFEEVAFRSWLKENPNGTRGMYACEVWGATLEVSDDVLMELPDGWVRQWARRTLGELPSCEQADGKENQIPPDGPIGPMPLPPFIGPMPTMPQKGEP